MITNNYPSYILNEKQLSWYELLVNGSLAPVTCFLTEHDYYSVLDKMELCSGELFPLPIVLSIPQNLAQSLSTQKSLLLKDSKLQNLAIMEVTSIFAPNLEKEKESICQSQDENHPYVQHLLKMRDVIYVGGHFSKLFSLLKHVSFPELRMTPSEAKSYFKENGWQTIIGFQTRNPMHRAHFEITLKAVDSIKEQNPKLFIQPSIGESQDCDIDPFIRIRCIQKLMDHYPKGMAKMAIINLPMIMAGPKEALLHAIIRQNYGCTHFIIGREQASPSSKRKDGQPFYGSYEAQSFVMKHASRLTIKVVCSEEVCYVKQTGSYETISSIKSQNLSPESISGTEIRSILAKNGEIPEWFTFKEIAEELQKSYSSNKNGFCAYVVGLPCSGKSFLVQELAEKLKELLPYKKLTIFDADIVRQKIYPKLGFSREDRSFNIRCIGYLASLITSQNGAVLVANIAPFEEDREYNRRLISENGRYYEIFMDTDLNICKQRDAKGLYAKAEKGEIKEFTGISSPFEKPIKPDLILKGDEDSEKNLELVLSFLKQKKEI